MEVEEVAAAVYLSVGLFKRRLQQVQVPGELSLPESSALRKLERGGPATVTALEARGLVRRQSDPADGRRAVMSVTEAGLSALSDKRSARIAQLARALAAGFTPEEMGQLLAAAPLIERLAESI